MSGPLKLDSTQKVILAVLAGFGGLVVTCCGGCGVIGVLGHRQKQVVLRQMEEADAKWRGGDKAAAAAIYRNHMDSSFLEPASRSLAYGRAIDFAFADGDPQLGKRLVEQAGTKNVIPSVNHPDAVPLVAALEAERARAAAERKRTQDERRPNRDSGGSSGSSTPSYTPVSASPTVSSDDPEYLRQIQAMKNAGTYTPEAGRNIKDLIEASRRINARDK